MLCLETERAQPYVEELYSNNGEVNEDYDGLDLRAQALYDYQAGKTTTSFKLYLLTLSIK